MKIEITNDEAEDEEVGRFGVTEDGKLQENEEYDAEFQEELTFDD